MSTYETKIEWKTKFGQFGWCGNSRRFSHGNHLLCENEYQSVYGKTAKQFICLIIHMPPTLFSQLNRIQIIDDTGFLANYTVGDPIKNPQTMIFKASKSDSLTKKIRIDYQKILPRIPTAHPLSRSPMNTIFSEYVTIAAPYVYNHEECICAICQEIIDAYKSDHYISHCGHIFHMSCIFQYLRATNNMDQNRECETIFRCDHGATAKPFPCPSCRAILETERID